MEVASFSNREPIQFIKWGIKILTTAPMYGRHMRYMRDQTENHHETMYHFWFTHENEQ